jgi:3-(3-hydroxy-phenyl)propionate hydroxylase
LIQLAIGMGRMVCTLDREAAATRDAGMLAARASGAPPLPPMRPAPFEAGCILAGSPAAGELFPQPTSGDGNDRLRLDDVLGSAPWLITRAPTTTTADGLQVADLDMDALAPFRVAMEAWFDKHQAEAVLVRPDRYVFGAGAPAALIAAWAAALKPLQKAA